MNKKFLILIYCLMIISVISGIDCKKSTGTSPEETEDEIQPGELYVDIYDSQKACIGTTLFTDTHDTQNLRVVEVDMDGTVVWEFSIPQSWIQGQPVGLDAELLDNGNILLVISGSGLYEIDRNGDLIWQLQDPNCSHDADRLPNGNTIFVYGNKDKKEDAQIKEVNQQKQLVWSWFARDHYNIEPYASQDRGGWAHTNAVTRMDNGNTLISPRNFDLTVEVDPQGNVVWEYNWLNLYNTTDPRGFDPHEPEIHSNNHLLVCLQWETPYQVVEIDRATGQPVWEYHRDNLRTARDCDRLPNGNTLIVGVLENTEDSVIFEVTSQGEVVWQLKIKDVPTTATNPGWFFKAQRIPQGS